jgi:hypothetical protein
MKRCSYCGFDNPAEALHCSECGIGLQNLNPLQVAQVQVQIHYIKLAILSIVLAFAHFLYAWSFSAMLFAMRGGVQKMPSGWTALGGIDKAWTPPVYLPGCLIIELGYRLSHRGESYPPQPYSRVGICLVFAGSLVAGFVAASTVLAAFRKERPILGIFLWRLWATILAWGWVLVPFEASWVYQWTVRY